MDKNVGKKLYEFLLYQGDKIEVKEYIVIGWRYGVYTIAKATNPSIKYCTFGQGYLESIEEASFEFSECDECEAVDYSNASWWSWDNDVNKFIEKCVEKLTATKNEIDKRIESLKAYQSKEG